MGIFQQINLTSAARPKKKGAILSLETMMYIAVIAVLIAVGIGGFSMYKSAKVSTAKLELDQIRSAMIEYSSVEARSNYPDDIDNLFDTLSASDTIDGMEHGPFLKAANRWSDGQALDPWGNSYYIDGDDIVSDGDPDNNDTIRIQFK